MSPIPKNPNAELSQYALDHLSYDPQTGVFTWKARAAQCTKIGSRAGTVRPLGYRFIELRGKAIGEHRLAWYFVHGEWPETEIDHKDRNPSNNAIDNLRVSTRLGNIQNQATKRGYWFDKDLGKFRSEIRSNGKRIYLGCFDTAEEARATYDAARREHHPTFVSTEGQSL